MRISVIGCGYLGAGHAAVIATVITRLALRRALLAVIAATAIGVLIALLGTGTVAATIALGQCRGGQGRNQRGGQQKDIFHGVYSTRYLNHNLGIRSRFYGRQNDPPDMTAV